MEWMILPYKRYFDFSGRSRRQEYWLFYLFYIIVIVVAAIIMLSGMPWREMETNPQAEPGIVFWVGFGLIALFALASLIPSIAVTVRRFHDQDMSGWMYLLSFIPYVGGIVVLVFMCIEGTKGPNRFGPDPLGRGEADAFI